LNNNYSSIVLDGVRKNSDPQPFNPLSIAQYVLTSFVGSIPVYLGGFTNVSGTFMILLVSVHWQVQL
jgi:hypothetical protein